MACNDAEYYRPVRQRRGAVSRLLCLTVVWPLRFLWRMITAIANAIGILRTLLIGLVLMIAGFALTGTIIGAVIGIPLFILGFLLLLRGLW
jgi:hypothetical protein